MAKKKYGLDDGCTVLIFNTGWLHALMTMVASVPATMVRVPPVLFVLNITPQILMKTLFVDK